MEPASLWVVLGEEPFPSVVTASQSVAPRMLILFLPLFAGDSWRGDADGQGRVASRLAKVEKHDPLICHHCSNLVPPSVGTHRESGNNPNLSAHCVAVNDFTAKG